MQQCI